MRDAEQPEGPVWAGRPDEVTKDLAELMGVLNAQEDMGRVLQRGVDQVISSIPGADIASVTVCCHGQGETAASSNERLWPINAGQYAAGDGPCLEAARTGEAVRVSVEQAQERWPDFARSARAAGVASYLSQPLFIEDDFAGSLDLYSEQTHGFSDFDVSVLRLYVLAAAAAIANARRNARARDLAEQLRHAIDSQTAIEQAIGVLIAQRGLTVPQARSELMRESQISGTKPGVIAARLIGNISCPP